jgi:glycosyltransferase involved in cell wall biosynthesis
MAQNTKYVIITPARDEEEHIAATIASVAGQSILPAEWVIVNDGSTDQTADVLDRCAAEYPWIHVIHRVNRGFRKAGGGVVEAFYEGYGTLQCDDWEFLVKLDADLSFSSDYFEKCFEHFSQEPRLGIGGGEICHLVAGELRREVNPKFHVRGATKIYKRNCWDAIGGLWAAPGWDTIDEVKANMLGWETRSFEDLPLHHHRLTGSAEGHVRDRMKHGIACYVSGYHPLFVAASCVYRLFRKPYLLGSVAMGYGFLKGFLTRIPQVRDAQLIHYMRAQQLRRMCGLQSIWK